MRVSFGMKEKNCRILTLLLTLQYYQITLSLQKHVITTGDCVQEVAGNAKKLEHSI